MYWYKYHLSIASFNLKNNSGGRSYFSLLKDEEIGVQEGEINYLMSYD